MATTRPARSRRRIPAATTGSRSRPRRSRAPTGRPRLRGHRAVDQERGHHPDRRRQRDRQDPTARPHREQGRCAERKTTPAATRRARVPRRRCTTSVTCHDTARAKPASDVRRDPLEGRSRPGRGTRDPRRSPTVRPRRPTASATPTRAGRCGCRPQEQADGEEQPRHVVEQSHARGRRPPRHASVAGDAEPPLGDDGRGDAEELEQRVHPRFAAVEIWNPLTARIAVATTPARPRARIHHANSASAATENRNDGSRSTRVHRRRARAKAHAEQVVEGRVRVLGPEVVEQLVSGFRPAMAVKPRRS